MIVAENINRLSELLADANFDSEKELHEQKRYDLQVHSEGLVLDKIITLFPNEDPKNTAFVVDSYEPITKSVFWRGVDNLQRIFNKTAIKTVGDAATISALTDINFFSKCIEGLIKIGTTKDPNAVAYWKREVEEDGTFNLELEFAGSDIVRYKGKDEIIIVDLDKSIYREEEIYDTYKIGDWNLNKRSQTYNGQVIYKGDRKVFQKEAYIYISKKQYIEFEIVNNQIEALIYDINVDEPYVVLGVDKDYSYNSALHPFIPYGNHALLQHRLYRIVENIYGYPRMVEDTMPCDDCFGRGKTPCGDCEDPNEFIECHSCHGTGQKTVQNPFNVYKRTFDPDRPENNITRPVVEFYHVGVDMLNYNKTNWQDTLKLAENAIYIQNREGTGNVESAKSKELNLQGMYSWLNRIGAQFYDKIQDLADTYADLTGMNRITIEVPMSYEIIGQLEAFDILNSIISSEAPIFIKNSQIDEFISKYISKSNPINRIVEILKKVDIFCFYTPSNLDMLSTRGIIDDNLWRTNTLAYPILMKMYAEDPSLLDKTDDEIIIMLNSEIQKIGLNQAQ